MLLERAGDIGGTWRDNTYPGCRCDVPVAPLLVLVRAEPELVQHLLAAGGDPRLPEGLRRALRRAAARPLRHRARERRVGRRRGPLADRDLDRADDRELPGRRAGPAVRAGAARGAGARGLRGHRLPLGAVGPRPRPDRRAGGRGRHRRVGDPVRPRDPAEGRQAARLPAHRAVGRPASQPAAQALGARRSTGSSRRRSSRCGPASTGRASCSCSCSATRRSNRLLEQLPLRHMRSQIKDPELRRKLTPGYSMGCKRILPDRRVVSGARAAERRGRHRWGRPRSGRTPWWPRTAPSARSTRSSSAPAST